MGEYNSYGRMTPWSREISFCGCSKETVTFHQSSWLVTLVL